MLVYGADVLNGKVLLLKEMIPQNFMTNNKEFYLI
jgi:hypothetical protein